MTVHEFGDRYTLIVPLFYKTVIAEVESEEVSNMYMKETLGEMSRKGLMFFSLIPIATRYNSLRPVVMNSKTRC